MVVSENAIDEAIEGGDEPRNREPRDTRIQELVDPSFCGGPCKASLLIIRGDDLQRGQFPSAVETQEFCK
eukprot:scaffold260732_cov21-Tisochrysis_lutea.AAC.1